MFKHLADLYVLYQVVQRLAKPWKEWEAYKVGVIDDKGNILVKGDKRTPEQKGVFTLFDVFVMNLKKIIQKVPYANSRIATYAAALFLLKESENITSEDQINELVEQFATDAAFLTEESAVPANNMGDGKIATTPVNMNGKGASILKRYKDIKKKKVEPIGE